jgi:YgiT-type zinc finger domain-containing protein
MKCPGCGAAELVRETRDISYTEQGKSTTIPAVSGEFCPACRAVVIDTKDAKRVSAALLGCDHQVSDGMKLKILHDDLEGFFKRAHEEARKLDAGEKLEPEIVISFSVEEDADTPSTTSPDQH